MMVKPNEELPHEKELMAAKEFHDSVVGAAKTFLQKSDSGNLQDKLVVTRMHMAVLVLELEVVKQWILGLTDKKDLKIDL